MEESKSEAAAIMAVAAMMTTMLTMVNDHNPIFVAFAETKFLPIPKTSVPLTSTCGNFSKERLDISEANINLQPRVRREELEASVLVALLRKRGVHGRTGVDQSRWAGQHAAILEEPV